MAHALEQEYVLAPATSLTGVLSEYVDFGAEVGRFRNPRQARGRIRVFAPIGDTLVTDLTPGTIARFFAVLARTPSPRTGRLRTPRTLELYQGFLRGGLDWAVEARYLDKSPMPHLRLVSPRASEDPIAKDQNRVSTAEMGMLLGDSRIPHLRRAFYVMGAYTGPRPSELIEMRWSDLLEDNDGVPYWLLRRQWQAYEREVRETKTSIARAVPLAPAVRQILDTQAKVYWPRVWGRTPEPNDLVFPSPKYGKPEHHISTSTLCRWLRRDLRMLGRRPRTFHTLRATFISRLRIELGCDPFLVEWVTHRSASREQGGAVLGGYTRGVYDSVRKMLCETLHYPVENGAQLTFSY